MSRSAWRWLAALAFLAAPVCAAGEEPEPVGKQQEKQFEKEITVKVKLDYLLYLPEGYGKDGQPRPLLLFLHGAGDNIGRLKRGGLPHQLEQKKDFPCIMVTPQCPGRGWDVRALGALLDDIMAKYQVDPARVYVTGLSMGGYGTWALAAANPERFAAIVPICGGGNPADAKKLKDLPAWVFHGAKDTVVPPGRSEAMVKALKDAGAENVKFTLYPEAGHDAWTETYKNPEVWEWLLKQKRSERPAAARAPDEPAFTHTPDVIYGKKLGLALTLDVFTPKQGANGAAVVLVVSGGWISDSQAINSAILKTFLAEPLKRGYTVFAVFHGSQPKFTIPEVVADVNRAVRFIRYHARDYHIDPDRIGITGGSAGGHLSLMLGTAGDAGNPKSSDPVERTSSRVQAVACLFPPTDFLNYGGEGKYAFAPDGVLAAFRAAVDVRELDPKTHRLERPADDKKAEELARQISPITHVSADDPPTLIVHGDADRLVPIQQAERIVARLKEVGVPAELVVRKGRGHDFSGGAQDVVTMTDWFDKYLARPAGR
jgi:acetyl esterase/lipase